MKNNILKVGDIIYDMIMFSDNITIHEYIITDFCRNKINVMSKEDNSIKDSCSIDMINCCDIPRLYEHWITLYGTFTDKEYGIKIMKEKMKKTARTVRRNYKKILDELKDKK